MAKIRFDGLKEYELRLSRLQAGATPIMEKAVYAGAKIVADEIRKNLEALPAVDDKAGIIRWQQQKPGPLTKTAKRGLLDSLGISPIQQERNFSVNVKIGFDGYNELKTQAYPNGQPNVLVARGAESGSSSTVKTPFVRPAVAASKKEAEKEMSKVLDREMKKIMD